jgi:pyruvate formate lyase activating enzyme
VDTSGHALSELLEKVSGLADLFLYDLKHMDPDIHEKYTGVDNMLILSNLDLLLDLGARVMLRIPVIPGINTTEQELERFKSFISLRRETLEEVHLLPYHRIAEGKYRRLGMPQPLADLKEPEPVLMNRLKKEFEETGLPVSIGG